MQTRVRFVDNGSKALTVLEIRAPRRHPLTQNVEHRLRKLGVKVVHAFSQRVGSDVELTLHVAGFDGLPLSQRRRLELQTLLLSNASPSEMPPADAALAAARSQEAINSESRDRESWPG